MSEPTAATGEIVDNHANVLFLTGDQGEKLSGFRA
jgi:hypothetical protein